jgi:hypothetical protein
MGGEDEVSFRSGVPVSARDLTCCFLRLGNVDNGAFDRLWKQTAQTIFLLQTIRRPLL